MSGKTCTKCKELKPLTEFYRAKNMFDGRRPDCASCHKRINRERKERDPLKTATYEMARGDSSQNN